MSSMKQLSGDTVRLITSSQVITSVYSVVKELIENSLDANADNIDVKLDNFGFDKIEVRDNGDGITPENALYMAQKHYTSKITDHADLDALATYGFRGEALGSLCAVSTVSIVTKTKEDAVSHLYTLDHHGKIGSTKPSHMGNGTTVTATNLFKNIPVRRQYYSNAKRRRDELKKVEDLLMSYGAIRPDIRVSLSHNKKPVWQKNKTSSQRNALLNTWGGSLMKEMKYAEKTDLATQVTIEAHLPKLDSDHQLTSRSAPDRCWISVNKRPVTLKEVEKTVKQYYCSTTKQDTGSVRHLIMFVAITVPTNLVDVNLEPNKTRVLLQNSDAILSLLTDLLQDLYGPLHGKESTDKTKTVPDIPPVVRETDNVARLDLNNTSLGSTDDELQVSNLDDQRTIIQQWPLPQFKLILDDQIEDRNEVEKSRENSIPKGSRENSAAIEPPSLKAPDMPSDLGSEDLKNNAGLQTTVRVDDLVVPTKDVSAKDFTNLKDCDTIPSTQPQFNLMDSSIDLFNNSTTETKKLTSTGNLGDVQNKVLDENKLDGSNEGNNGMQKDASTNIIGDMSNTDWSKGVGLRDSGGRAIQPSALLVPGRCPTDGHKQTSSGETGCSNISNNQFGKKQVPVGSLSAHSSTEIQLIPNDNLARNSLPPNQTLAQKDSGSKLSTSKDVADSQTAEIALCTAMYEEEATTSGDLEDQTRSPGRARKSPLEAMSGQTTLYDLVGSTAVKRPIEAFAFFSRQLRASIVKENPSLDFAAVNALLEKKWEQLSDDEKKEYQRKGHRDTLRYQEQMKTAKQTRQGSPGVLQMPPKKKKKLEKLANQNLIDEMLASQGCQVSKKEKKKAAKSVSVKEITVNFSLQGLEPEQKKHKHNRSGVESKWTLIGQISSNNLWLAVKEHHLLVLNQYRIEEALLYNRLMATHILPVEKCDTPVLLNKSMLGGDENWISLLSLQSVVTPPDPDRYFIDERLKSNGFHIKQTTDNETSDVQLQLVAMTTYIPYYGINDLKEILDLITQGGNTLTKCRAVTTTNFLQGEAMRMARNLSADLSEEEIYDIISRMEKHLLPRQQNCLHGKPFVEFIYDLNHNDMD